MKLQTEDQFPVQVAKWTSLAVMAGAVWMLVCMAAGYSYSLNSSGQKQLLAVCAVILTLSVGVFARSVRFIRSNRSGRQ